MDYGLWQDMGFDRFCCSCVIHELGRWYWTLTFRYVATQPSHDNAYIPSREMDDSHIRIILIGQSLISHELSLHDCRKPFYSHVEDKPKRGHSILTSDQPQMRTPPPRRPSISSAITSSGPRKSSKYAGGKWKIAQKLLLSYFPGFQRPWYV